MKILIWSEFEVEHYKENHWEKSSCYYLGDLSHVDLATDWRFKEVPDKRKQAKFMGLTDNPPFEISFRERELLSNYCNIMPIDP